MRNTLSLLSLLGLLRPGVASPDTVLSMSQIELNCVLIAKLNCLKWNCFWHSNCVLVLNWTVWNRIVLMFKLLNYAKLSLLGLLGPGVASPDTVLSMSQIELNCVLIDKLNCLKWNCFWHSNCVLMLNWTVWNRIVLMFKLLNYAKLNCFKWKFFLHWNSELILNQIVRNRTVYMYK